MLPVIKAPTFSLKLPSNNQKVVYRPFQVKEEKILLIAQKSEDNEDQIRAIKQILTNCVIEPEDFNPDNVASFDIEYLFLKLRAKSVGETVKIKVLPQEREGLPPMDAEINIDELEPYFDPSHTNMIELDKNTKLKMKYPTLGELLNIQGGETDETALFTILRDSIDTIYMGEEVYESKDQTKEELDDFMDSFTSKQFAELQKFFQTLPTIKTEIEYKWVNPEDSKDVYTETVTVQGLTSFLS